jgi:hypothetical protein
MHDIFGREDRVAYRWSASGTHLGEWMGIPSTALHLTTTGITIHRIAGGKCVEGWVSVDISRSEEEKQWLLLLMSYQLLFLARALFQAMFVTLHISQGKEIHR